MEEQEKEQIQEERHEPKERPKKKTFMTEVNEWISLDKVIEHLPFILFLTVLGLLYTGNRLYAEKQIRKANKIETELKEKRWEFMTTKSEMMTSSMQSQVSKTLAPFGIKELITPPKKIVKKD